MAETDFFRGTMTAERQQMLAGQAMNGRSGTPQDVASVVTWLCGPGARHVTGQVIQVNGGANVGH